MVASRRNNQSFQVLILFATTTVLLASVAYAQHEGHDMDWGLPAVPATNNGHGGMITPYIHFSTGDHVWFKEWTPKTKGAMFGACLGLFLLAIVERWLAAMRAVANLWWRMRTSDLLDYLHDSRIRLEDEKGKSPERTSSPSPTISLRKFRARLSPPFITLNEICRGVLYAAQSFLFFAFMLVAMTYQASYIISMVLGLGVGEMLFGRYTNAHVGLFV